MTDKSKVKAYSALAVVCIVWGTTYLAITLGVKVFPPFLFSGIRQVSAGLLLLTFTFLFRKKIKINKREILHQAIPGILTIGISNGMICWAQQHIPGGLAALIVTIVPVYVVVLNFLLKGKNRIFNFRIAAGLLLGCVGVALIFNDHIQDLINPNYFSGIIVTFLAAACWAVGTVYVKQHPSDTDSWLNASVQLLSGGLVVLAFALAHDDITLLKNVTFNSLIAMAYLIVFGSIIAFLCYLYALKNLPVGIATTYTYINPLVAILLGAMVLNEHVTSLTGLAFLTISASVYFINSGHKKKEIPTENIS